MLTSELELDAPVAVDVGGGEDRLQECLGPPRVELLDVLEERAHARGERADRLLALPLLREPSCELRLPPGELPMVPAELRGAAN